MTGARQPMAVHCGDCGHDWAIAMLPLNLSIAGRLKGRCPLCGSKNQLMGFKPVESAVGELDQWLHRNDTGTSSLTIFSVLAARPDVLAGRRGDVPYDTSDFGRCYRLLKIAPGWRERLGEVAAVYPKWAPLVAAWDELTVLYEACVDRGGIKIGAHPTAPCVQFYARISELLEGNR
jgi:hypothetical protein